MKLSFFIWGDGGSVGDGGDDDGGCRSGHSGSGGSGGEYASHVSVISEALSLMVPICSQVMFLCKNKPLEHEGE